MLRVVPGDREVRVREVQVHGRGVEQASGGGRVALNLASTDVDDLHRGDVLAAPGRGHRDQAPAGRPRARVRPRPRRPPGAARAWRAPAAPPGHGPGRRRRGAQRAALGRTARRRRDCGAPARAPGRRHVRRPVRPAPPVAGHGRSRWPDPRPVASARGLAQARDAGLAGSRRRGCRPAASLGRTRSFALWGAVRADRLPRARPTSARRLGPVLVDPDLAAALEAAATEAAAQSVTIADLRQSIVQNAPPGGDRRRWTTPCASRTRSSTTSSGAERSRRRAIASASPGRSEPLPPEVVEAMERVVAALSVAAPPPLSEVVRAAGCPPEGMRALAASDRIVRLEADLAYARPTYARLAGLALKMAAAAPLTPGRVPGRHRHEPQVRAGDPRGPRPARAPRADRGRPRPGPARTGAADGRTGPCSGVVLAGGRSTRFGRDKLAEPVGGGTLLDRAIAALAGLCSDITVVIGADAAEPAIRERPGATVRVVRDPEPDRGPVLGLATGLEAAPHPIVVVVGGDMPSLVPEVLRLLAAEVAAGASAAALEDGGRLRPLPCGVRPRSRTGGRARRARGRRGRPACASVLASLDAVVVPEAVWRELDPEAQTLRDVDRPADLAAWRRLGGPAPSRPRAARGC